MYCCSNCFSSPYLRDVINSDFKIGDCGYCKSRNVSIYKARRLIPFFRSILSLYELNEKSDINIVAALNRDFSNRIFSDAVVDDLSLLKSIVEEEMDDFSGLLNARGVSLQMGKTHARVSNDIHNKWKDFKNEIKNINRFHIQSTIDLDKLRNIFDNDSFQINLKKGCSFYRSRVSDNGMISTEFMANPPKDKATGGRANPKGISYLYLANNIKTSLYETRAKMFDFVTVGYFELKENAKILNLLKPENDPIVWAEQEAIIDYLTYIPFIDTLQKELSLPIRKRDKEIDYLPTQYLSEFIKSIGYDGVEFQSSLNSDGYNLAIFNPEKFKCVKTFMYEIENINLNYRELKT